MDATTFFNNFELIASAPNGIEQLREMILHLAVQGKLTERKEIESSSELFFQVKEQKKNYKKLQYEQKPINNITLPDKWIQCALGDLVLSITGGGTPSKQIAEYWNGDIPWASVKDLGTRKVLNHTHDHITPVGLENSSSNLIPKGRIIVCTRMGLGKIAIPEVPIAINQDLKALEIADGISIDFFYYWYKTISFEGTGTTVKGIKQQELLSLPFPLPPKAEQGRIIVIVKRLLAICDRLESLTKKLYSNEQVKLFSTLFLN